MSKHQITHWPWSDEFVYILCFSLAQSHHKTQPTQLSFQQMGEKNVRLCVESGKCEGVALVCISMQQGWAL